TAQKQVRFGVLGRGHTHEGEGEPEHAGQKDQVSHRGLLSHTKSVSKVIEHYELTAGHSWTAHFTRLFTQLHHKERLTYELCLTSPAVLPRLGSVPSPGSADSAG